MSTNDEARDDVDEAAPAADAETDPDSDSGPDPAELAARIETLEAENERLRSDLAAVRQRRYRYTALGLFVVGMIALLGAALFPAVQTVLIALGGTGVFGGVLTYMLTPERFISATVGERIYGTLADNEAAIVDDLDLAGDPVVVPATGSGAPARLFVPQRSDADLPVDDALRVPFVTGEVNGLAIAPTGAGLYDTLTDTVQAMPSDASGIATTVGDALVEQFELVDGVDVDVGEDDAAGRVTMAVDGSAYGPLDRFDHPVASLLATTLAVEFDTPVTVEVDEAERADWIVTCRLETER